tara:strand:+ start:6115 stop:6585 length:471 start_codon:yes stop_codon:yes gene_type:complete
MEYIKGNNDFFSSLLEFCHHYNELIKEDIIVKKGSYYPRLSTTNKRGFLAFKEVYLKINNMCKLSDIITLNDIQEFIKAPKTEININQMYTTKKFISYLKTKNLIWEISAEPFIIEMNDDENIKKEAKAQILNYCKNFNYEKKDYVELIKACCSLI